MSKAEDMPSSIVASLPKTTVEERAVVMNGLRKAMEALVDPNRREKGSILNVGNTASCLFLWYPADQHIRLGPPQSTL